MPAKIEVEGKLLEEKETFDGRQSRGFWLGDGMELKDSRSVSLVRSGK